MALSPFPLRGARPECPQPRGSLFLPVALSQARLLGSCARARPHRTPVCPCPSQGLLALLLSPAATSSELQALCTIRPVSLPASLPMHIPSFIPSCIPPCISFCITPHAYPSLHPFLHPFLHPLLHLSPHSFHAHPSPLFFPSSLPASLQCLC